MPVDPRGQRVIPRTLIGASLAAALSLYASLGFYGEQIDRNKAAPDSYQIANQETAILIQQRQESGAPDARRPGDEGRLSREAFRRHLPEAHKSHRPKMGRRIPLAGWQITQ